MRRPGFVAGTELVAVAGPEAAPGSVSRDAEGRNLLMTATGTGGHRQGVPFEEAMYCSAGRQAHKLQLYADWRLPPRRGHKYAR